MVIQKLLKEASQLPVEEIVIEALRDLVKDEVKKRIRETLDSNPELKKEIKDTIGQLLEAKLKETAALVRLTKCSAKLGMNMLPEHLRDELAKELVSIFEKEVSMILEKGI
jgi:hypothetical protein